MPIYLDHAATSPVRREVVDAMLPFLTEVYGNPSSAHAYGRAARAALDDAHEQVAAGLGAEARGVELIVEKGIPLAGGLGGSAASARDQVASVFSRTQPATENALAPLRLVC
jgi:cysteine desulfurase